jgi:hypothetical protein
VGEAETILDTYSKSSNYPSYKSTLQQAKESLEEGRSVQAYDLINTLMGMFKRDERTELDRSLIEARHYLTVAKEMGSESITLNDRLAKAEQMRFDGNLVESARITADVSQYAKSIIHEELAKRLAQLNKSVNVSRKNGIEVLQTERISEESARAMSKADLL